MEIRCPYCEKTVQVPGGGQFTCPSCRAVFAVDLEPPPPAPAAPGAPPPPLPATTPGAPPPLPGTSPGAQPGGAGGAICAKHPGRPAAEVCRRCGNFMCSLCVIPVKSERYCPDCIDKIGGVAGGTGTVPWEADREKLGIFSAYWNTAKMVLYESTRFFDTVPDDGPVGSPVGFYVFGLCLFLLPAMLLGGGFFIAMLLSQPSPPGGMPPTPVFIAIGAAVVVLMPVMAAAGLFINAAFYHVVALLCGARAGYGTTLRILGFTHGACVIPQALITLLGMIPCLGALVQLGGGTALFVLQCIIMYRGFKRWHALSEGKALVCVLWPLIVGAVCCVGYLVLVFVVMAGAAGGGGSGGGGGF